MYFHSSSRGFSAPEDTIIYRLPNCFMTFGSCLNAFMPWSEPIKLWISQFEGYRKWIVKNGITNSFPTRKNGQPIIAVTREKFILSGPQYKARIYENLTLPGLRSQSLAKDTENTQHVIFLSNLSEFKQNEKKIYLKMRS